MKNSKSSRTFSLKPRSSEESAVEMNDIVLPSHANALGTIFGGVLMGWIDIAAAICAQRHSRRIAVTASVDALYFIAPIQVGDMVNLRARIVHTGRTSMVISVNVTTENPLTGEKKECVTAHLSFVALDSAKKPTAVPPLLLKTKSEKEEFEWAAQRRKVLLEQRKEQERHKQH
jgi:acyl-CoA hydrolase